MLTQHSPSVCCLVKYFFTSTGMLHNSSLSTRRFIKINVYHTAWTKYMLPNPGTGSGGFLSLDHAAFWCKLWPQRYQYPCHMFHCHDRTDDKWCYFASRDNYSLVTFVTFSTMLINLRNIFPTKMAKRYSISCMMYHQAHNLRDFS